MYNMLLPVAALSKAYRNEKKLSDRRLECICIYIILSLWMFSHAQIISQNMGIISMKSPLICATFPDSAHISPTVNSKA
jgi:hypothetical protein